MMAAESSISFVVLHYNAFQETIDCINSILNNVKAEHLNVVAVDNCSPNGSGEIIKETFKNVEKVYYIGLNENAGFAKGNNAGIEYAKDVLKSDFVCCINNDTIVEQSDFFEQIVRIFNETNAAVIGPKVFLKDKSYQRFFTKLESVSYYKKQLNTFRKRLFKNRIKLLLSKVGIRINGSSDIKKANVAAANDQDRSFFETEHKDVILHGCCLIFTPSFFDQLRGFSPETFLYREEEILFIDIVHAGLHNIYSPDIYILHLEDAATNTLFDSDYKKKVFVTKNIVRSTKVLIKHMQ